MDVVGLALHGQTRISRYRVWHTLALRSLGNWLVRSAREQERILGTRELLKTAWRGGWWLLVVLEHGFCSLLGLDLEGSAWGGTGDADLLYIEWQ